MQQKTYATVQGVAPVYENLQQGLALFVLTPF